MVECISGSYRTVGRPGWAHVGVAPPTLTRAPKSPPFPRSPSCFRYETQLQSRPYIDAPVVESCEQWWSPGASESLSRLRQRAKMGHHHHHHLRIPLTVELSCSLQPCGNICIAVAPCFMKLPEWAGRRSERVAAASAGESDNEQQIGPSGPVHAKNDI